MSECELCGNDRQLFKYLVFDGVLNRIKAVCKDCIDRMQWKAGEQG